MIPPDVATRIQPPTDLALRPVLPAQEITDKLPGLVAGQRLLAEVQALLPNGTYRALINQRSVTLALPFAAKSGDAIEMEVAESNGKLTLAIIARGAAEGGKASGESTATHLSSTGQLIGTLLAGARDGKGGAPVALPLNGNQPIATGPLNRGSDLLPLLKQAITQSGMFYEAHQAEWVEGRYSKSQLLQEPQGKLAAGTAPPVPQGPLAAGASDGANRATAASSPPPATTQPVAPQVQAIVQQQLEAFATQSFSWQGQVWPGQKMQWEIEKQADGRTADDDNAAEKWQTRLRMMLPRLGAVDARLHIQGQQLTLTVTASDAETRVLLRSATASLQRQLENAGLNLASLGITAPMEDQTDVQPGK